MATGVDEYIFTNSDVFPEIRIKRREYLERLRYFAPEQLRKASSALGRRMIRRIQTERNATCLVAHLIHKRWISPCRVPVPSLHTLKSSVVILSPFEFYRYIARNMQGLDTVTVDTAYFNQIVAVRPVLAENRHVAPRCIDRDIARRGAQPRATPSVVRAGEG